MGPAGHDSLTELYCCARQTPPAGWTCGAYVFLSKLARKDITMMITKKQTNKTTDVPAELRRETVSTNTV